MQLVSILILLLSQASIADVTAKRHVRENCQGSVCSSQSDNGASKEGGGSSDARKSTPMPEKERPQPRAGAGGEPAGTLYKNQPPKQNKNSSESRVGAGGDPPGASYKNRPPVAKESVPK